MTTLTYFKKILLRQNEIGYSFPNSLNPPADIKQIKEIEQELGFELTTELRDLYLFANGTQIQSIGLDNCLIPLHRFLNLQDALKYYNDYVRNELLFNELFENWTTNTKPGKHLFPFIADDLHCYWVDLNNQSKNYGQLYSAINNGDSPEYEFSSLSIFFKFVLECYNKNIFFLKSENMLSWDFTRYWKLGRKLNPDIKYWKIVIENLQAYHNK
jgi:cell wall assembly regulator SMI1